jgi:hypothetical protein
MTEHDWDNSQESWELLRFVSAFKKPKWVVLQPNFWTRLSRWTEQVVDGVKQVFDSHRLSERKVRLLACASCRYGELLRDQRWVIAIDTAERYADGECSPNELYSALKTFREIPEIHALILTNQFSNPLYRDAIAVSDCLWTDIRQGLSFGGPLRHALSRGFTEEALCSLIRHVVGNPFRRSRVQDNLPFSAECLARSLYAGESCSFALHDALLEAGHPELAAHFREAEHPKGCWALDLILGKS